MVLPPFFAGGTSSWITPAGPCLTSVVLPSTVAVQPGQARAAYSTVPPEPVYFDVSPSAPFLSSAVTSTPSPAYESLPPAHGSGSSRCRTVTAWVRSFSDQPAGTVVGPSR